VPVPNAAKNVEPRVIGVDDPIAALRGEKEHLLLGIDA
jgi:hypothetical protein